MRWARTHPQSQPYRSTPPRRLQRPRASIRRMKATLPAGAVPSSSSAATQPSAPPVHGSRRHPTEENRSTGRRHPHRLARSRTRPERRPRQPRLHFHNRAAKVQTRERGRFRSRPASQSRRHPRSPPCKRRPRERTRGRRTRRPNRPHQDRHPHRPSAPPSLALPLQTRRRHADHMRKSLPERERESVFTVRSATTRRACRPVEGIVQAPILCAVGVGRGGPWERFVVGPSAARTCSGFTHRRSAFRYSPRKTGWGKPRRNAGSLRSPPSSRWCGGRWLRRGLKPAQSGSISPGGFESWSGRLHDPPGARHDLRAGWEGSGGTPRPSGRLGSSKVGVIRGEGRRDPRGRGLAAR